MKVIVLAGGKGTRLWPLSREKYSKQNCIGYIAQAILVLTEGNNE